MNSTKLKGRRMALHHADLALWGILVFATTLTQACVHSDGYSPPLVDSATPSSDTQTSPSPLNSSIRAVDFKNFTYLAKPIYANGDKTFTLQNGTYAGRHDQVFGGFDLVSLDKVSYGDVTRDGVEEAFVVLSESTKGTAVPRYVYIYTLEKGKPKLIWTLDPGDRGDGGLRQVYAEGGDLVVELYGRDTVIGQNLMDRDEAGACCPKSFTRTFYQWKGNHFQQKGDPQVFPNPD